MRIYTPYLIWRCIFVCHKACYHPLRRHIRDPVCRMCETRWDRKPVHNIIHIMISAGVSFS